jgi:hypothetical protein
MHTDVQTERGADQEFSEEMVDYEVRADDETAGKIERVTFENDWAVVVSGGLLKKHRHAIPAWAIRVVDVRNETVLVGLTKDEIEGSPDYDECVGMEDDQRVAIHAYYDELLRGRPQRVRAA